MFKKFVKRAVALKNWDAAMELWFEIDIAFQHEKITWNDHETLFELINRLDFDDKPGRP